MLIGVDCSFGFM